MFIDEIKSELKRLKTEAQDLKKFGITMGVILGILAGVTGYRGSWSFPFLFVLAIGFLAIGLLKPLLLKQVYIGWMAIAAFMGFVMTRVILSVMFYGVFTVSGLIGRMFHKDMLDEQYDANAATYWKPHPKPQDRKKHLEHQF